MFDIDEFLYDNSTDLDFIYEQMLCEWNVDPKKKRQLFLKTLKLLKEEVNKNKFIKDYVHIFSEETITTYNKTLYNAKNQYYENKFKWAITGYYDFKKANIPREIHPYKELKKCVNAVNEKLEDSKITLNMDIRNDWVGFGTPGAMIIAGLLNLGGAATRKSREGLIQVKVKSKDSISESCNRALDISDDIMDDLFN